jgi:exopolysaccharide biosynthesis polyprenyl glycosylphosphotransferase
MTPAELSVALAASRRGLRRLEAQRMIDLVALRLAPSLAAGLIFFSHSGEAGPALVMFASVLLCLQALVHPGLPLHLLPASRILLGLAGPVAGAAIAGLIALGFGETWPPSEFTTPILASWIVMALGAWTKARSRRGLRARVAVIGSREVAADIVSELDASGVSTYEVVGWIGAGYRSEYQGLRWLGDVDEVRHAVLAQGVDLLVVAGHPDDAQGEAGDDAWSRVAVECLELPVRLIAASQLYEETFGHVPVGMIDAAWYRYIMHPRFRAAEPLSKRLFDLVFGTLIALIFLPVLAIAALAIKLIEGGPVLYRQRRLGELGHEFEILKLRTMRVDAEADGPQWAEAGDDRVTRVGRLLRRSHLDELPQLWNVLRGEMTMVGPRPERPEMVAELERRFPHYTRRQLVKPGIAGWAALRCGYAGSDLGTAWKLCHDLFYIKRRSVLADTLILAETAVEVFRDAHRGLRKPDERFLVGETPDHVERTAAGSVSG